MPTPPNFTDGTWTVAATAHIAGDPNGDILWQNIADQSLVLWQQNGATTTAVTALPSIDNFNVATVGDFDGDGVGDPFLKNGSQHKILLSKTGVLTDSLGYVEDVRAAIDLNADGKDDVIAVGTDNKFDVRTMDGATRLTWTTFNTGYVAGDALLAAFDGTGTTSFRTLWFDVSANAFDLARYTAGVRTVTNTFTVQAGTEFANKGDYNGDGSPDFLFLDKVGAGKGNADIVFTNGVVEIGRITWSSADASNQQVVAGGDFDNDGNTELLVRDGLNGNLRLVNAVGGSPGSDTLLGSHSADLIDGRNGSDRIWGQGGDDILLGGEGPDTVFGGADNDWIDGGAGNNSLFGDAGNDTITAGPGDDYVRGGAGDDSLTAGTGMDFIDGDEGDDYLVGGAFGFHHLRGGPGNDILIGDDNVIMEGGEGNDILQAENGLDNLFGGPGDDFIVGDLSSDTLYGGDGNDILFGTDRFGLSGASDTYYGGAGQDFFYLGNKTTKFYTGSGEAIIKDFSEFQGDKIVLSGFSSEYNFNDLGAHIQIRLASNNNVIATVENAFEISTVQNNLIFIG